MAAAVDAFTGRTSKDDPYTHAEVVTPSDTVDLTNVSRAIYVGVSGDVKAALADDAGTAVVFKAVPVGLFRIRATRIWSTGTTATNMVAIS